jgi:predicted dehydrogenase
MQTKDMTRRDFITTASAAALSCTVVAPQAIAGTAANSRIKTGIIGLGGRGSWITGLVREHGGYEIVALADYFPHVADAAGEEFKVPKARRFSGLSSYQALIAADVEAVFLETPPYCFPEHVEAAVTAGRHIYIAKPLGCDVPGCVRIRKAAERSQRQKKVFLCDFQTRTHPFFIEAIKRVHNGAIGEIGMISSEYNDESFPDPPLTANVESRLQSLIWVNDDTLGGSYLVNSGIHAVDVALWVAGTLWVAGKMPVSAMGASRVTRSDPHGDSHDVYSITYEFANGLILNHRGEHLKNRSEFCGDCFAQGQDGYLESGYASRVRILGNRTGYRGGDIVDLYKTGAEGNIAAFHRAVINGDYDNPTVEPSIDATLATILGREAARKRTKLTLDEVLRENRRLEPDLTGLKA